MKRVADGVWQLDRFAFQMANAFYSDGILFDCRTRWAAGSIARKLQHRMVSVIALTHAHPDHWGAAPALSARLGAEVAVHEDDAGVVTGRRLAGSQLAFRLGKRFLEAGTCSEVVRLNEGDRVGEFTVVHAPGHSAGHVVYFRESDRVAVIGDLFRTIDSGASRPRLAEPPPNLSLFPEENRRSILKLARLRPSVVLPGHGPPLRDMAVLDEFAERIAATPDPSLSRAL